MFPWKLRILEILHNPETKRCARVPADKFKRPPPPKYDQKKQMPKDIPIPKPKVVEEVKPVEQPVKVEEQKQE